MTIARQNSAREFLFSTYGDEYDQLKFTVVMATRLGNGELDWTNRKVRLLAMTDATLSKLISYSDEPGTEVFYTPVPRTAKGDPSAANSGDGRSVYADVDKRALATADRMWLRKNRFSFIKSGGVVVGEDGRESPRFHVHVGLSSPTPPHEVEALNAALAAKLGADSKTSAAALLRLPGTRNWKPQNIGPNGLGALVAVSSLSYRTRSVSELRQALGTDASSTSAPVRTQRVEVVAVPAAETFAKYSAKGGPSPKNLLRVANQKFKEGNYERRHLLAGGLIKDLLRVGLTQGEALGVLLECDAATDKWTTRQIAADVARVYVKATADSVAEQLAGTQAEPEKRTKPKPSTSRFLSRQQLRERPEPQWLVERLIPEYGIGQLFGPTYGGKTYAAIDLVMRITSGMNHWIGHTIKLNGPVFYVLMEGGFDFAKRLDAWEMKHGRTSDELYVMVEEELNLADPASLEQLAEDITAVSSTPRLLVIDTQSLAIQGVEENDNTGMNEVMQKLKRLSKTLGCFVLLVHHTGYATEERGRGASAQPAALDTIIRIKGSDKDGRKIAVPKVKAGREVKDRDFRLEEQKNGWPAFVEITGMEALEQYISNEDKIIRYLRWNGPLTPPAVAEGIEGVAYSTIANHMRDMADPGKCAKGEKPRLVVSAQRGKSKVYSIAEHLREEDDAPNPADL
ncbi:AAA family ATPase [Streptomyces sp. NPDC004311]|uniref:AAA family ATPase n=1 Tax=Streptomyces sp. NPDC004311 TaxID=3364698 RepID=UPI0036B4810B